MIPQWLLLSLIFFLHGLTTMIPRIEAKAVDSKVEANEVDSREIVKAVLKASNMVIKRRKRSDNYEDEYEYDEEYSEHDVDHDEHDEGYNEHDAEYDDYEEEDDDYKEEGVDYQEMLKKLGKLFYPEESEKYDKYDVDEVVDVGPSLKGIDAKFLGKVDKLKKVKQTIFDGWLKIIAKKRKALFKLWKTKHLKKDEKEDGNEEVLYVEKHLYKTSPKHKPANVKPKTKAKKLKLPKKHESPRHPSNAWRRYLNLSRMLGISTNETNMKH